MLALENHVEEGSDTTRKPAGRKTWSSMTARGRQISADGVKAARKLAVAIREYFRRKHEMKAAENVAFDYGATDRQVRRWFVTGPTFPTFALMLEREGPSLMERVAAVFARNDQTRRRFRWRRGTKEA